MGALRFHARPNLLFGRKRGNLAPPKRCAMGVRDMKKAHPPPSGGRWAGEGPTPTPWREGQRCTTRRAGTQGAEERLTVGS